MPTRGARIGAGRGRQAPSSLLDPRTRTIEPKVLAALAAQLADAKKAVDIRVYDVAEHIKVADFFVIISGTSRPHVRAIYEELHVRLKALGEKHGHVEGEDLGWWILADYVDVVVHVLQPEAREYYALDQLYSECPELDWRGVAVPQLTRASNAG